MHGLDLIITLTGGLVAALVGGYLTQRLKLSPIVGYILAGLVVGPYTPGFVADRHVAEQLAEVGVILLMFGVGLQLHLEDLLAVKRVAIPGAIFQSLVATAIGAFVVERAGWGLSAGIVYGVALSVASTVVLVRVLSDNRQLHTPTGHIAVGWLVVEDLFTVLVLVLMPAIFAESGGRTVPVAIGLALVKVVALGGLTIVVGGRVLPWVLTQVARTQSRELFTLAVLAIALGIAVSSAQVFGVSMALGAFLAGLVVGRSEFGVRATSDALPMRDAFAVLFFVSVGMLLDPGTLARRSADAGGDAGHRPDRQAAGRDGHRPAVPLSAEGGAVGRGGAGADRRVLVHRRLGRHRLRRADRRCHQRPRRGRHRVDHAQPAPLPQHRLDGALADPRRAPPRTRRRQPTERAAPASPTAPSSSATARSGAR